ASAFLPLHQLAFTTVVLAPEFAGPFLHLRCVAREARRIDGGLGLEDDAVGFGGGPGAVACLRRGIAKRSEIPAVKVEQGVARDRSVVPVLEQGRADFGIENVVGFVRHRKTPLAVGLYDRPHTKKGRAWCASPGPRRGRASRASGSLDQIRRAGKGARRIGGGRKCANWQIGRA